MITSRLRRIMALCIVLFLLHGLEEWFSGFYDVDPTFGLAARLAPSKAASVFVGSQIALWVMLVVFYILLLGAKWRLRALVLFGLVVTFEVEHVVLALVKRAYYPGAVTSTLFIPLAVLFWMELRRVWQMTTDMPVTKDAVCGMQVPVGDFSPHAAYQSHDYWFCSVACKGKFEREPDAYALSHK